MIGFTINWRTEKNNNVAVTAYVEAARCDYILGIMGRFDYPTLDFVLARHTIDYLAELHDRGN